MTKEVNIGVTLDEVFIPFLKKQGDEPKATVITVKGNQATLDFGGVAMFTVKVDETKINVGDEIVFDHTGNSVYLIRGKKPKKEPAPQARTGSNKPRTMF